MTLGDDVLSVVPEFRLAAQSMMCDRGTVSRGAGGGTVDPATGVFTPGAATVVYSGVCRVRKPNEVEHQTVFGDLNVTVTRYLVSLPFDVPLFAIGDVFIVGESADSEIVAVPMRVVAVVGKSVLLYRQLGVEVIE